MKKSTGLLVLIVFVFMTAITWISVFKNQAADEAAFNEHMSAAKSAVEKGIFIDALNAYKEALKMDPDNYDIVIEITEMYYKLGDYSGFLSSCDEAIAIDSSKVQPYIMKSEYYISRSQFAEAVNVLKVASAETDNENEKITELQEMLTSKYINKYVSFQDIGDWHVQEDTNYLAVNKDGKWGMVAKDGSRIVRYIFDYIGAYDKKTGVIPCCYEGEYYYIDLDGNKKLVGDYEYQYLGPFGDGIAPAQRDNVYGYIDTKFNEQHFKYTYAGAFANGIAAVEKDNKWALINSKFEEVTGFIYDDILVDSYGYCSMFSIIIARQDSKYIMIDHSGNKIIDKQFDEVAMAASNDEPIAVKMGQEWGFVTQEGNVIIDAQYLNAKSFSLGLAPIEMEDGWGYINLGGEIVIDTEYEEARPFSADGSAPIKDSIYWSLIVLCEYEV